MMHNIKTALNMTMTSLDYPQGHIPFMFIHPTDNMGKIRLLNECYVYCQKSSMVIFDFSLLK